MDEKYALPLTVGSVTLTSDGYIVLGVRKEIRSNGKNYVSLIPVGYFDPLQDKINKQYDVKRTLLRELKEEVGIRKIKRLTGLGMICDYVEKQQPLILFRLHLPHTRKLLENKQLKEHSKLIFIVDGNLHQLKKLVKKYALSTHALGGLLLHMRLQAPKRC